MATPYTLPIYVWYDIANCPKMAGWYWDDVKDRPFELAVGPFPTRFAACEDARGFFNCPVEFLNPHSDEEAA